MNYIVKWPDGSTDDASLDGIRREYKTGGVSDDCTVRRNDSQTWQTVRELLESLGELKPLTEEEIAIRALLRNKQMSDQTPPANNSLQVATVILLAVIAIILLIVLVPFAKAIFAPGPPAPPQNRMSPW